MDQNNRRQRTKTKHTTNYLPADYKTTHTVCERKNKTKVETLGNPNVSTFNFSPLGDLPLNQNQPGQ